MRKIDGERLPMRPSLPPSLFHNNRETLQVFASSILLVYILMLEGISNLTPKINHMGASALKTTSKMR